MLPIRLELVNFLAYRNPDPITFEGIHLACLSGANGAGKSSLLDAITWALWGKARARFDDDLIHQGQTEMLVQLDFLQGETCYRVVRRRQKGKTAKTGRSSLDLFVWDGDAGQWQPNNAPSLRDTERRIESLLHLDYETFVHSAFLQQGRADAFTLKPPSQRKDILANILGLDQWWVYEERARQRIDQIENNLRVTELDIKRIEDLEAEEPALRRALDVALEAQTAAAAELERAEARYAEVKDAESRLHAAQGRLAQAQNRIRQHDRELSEIAARIARYDDQIAHQNEILAERESIEAGYATLQEARAADLALGEKLQAMQQVKDELNRVTERIQAARAEIEAQISVHRDRIANAERQSSDLDGLRADLADVLAEVRTLEDEQQRREDLREAISGLEAEIAELKGINRGLYAEMQTIKARQEQLQAAEAVCPLCGQPLSDEHKVTMLDELQAQGTERGDAHRANRARITEIEGIIQTHRETIAALDVELRRLDGLRERAAALGSRAEQAQDAADTLHTEHAELHALETMLEAGDYAHELQKQRAAIQQQIEQLGYDSEAHTAARETLSTFHAYELRQRELELAQQQLPALQEEREASLRSQERWLKARAEEVLEVERVEAEIGSLAVQVEEARRREDEVRRCRRAESDARADVVRAEQGLKAVEDARQRKAELQARAAELNIQKGIYSDLRVAFGKNGIPAMIIEAAIPELEEAANHLLSRMTGGRMFVRLDTQREKRTGGVAETLDILISDELGTRSYESYSGGEAFRVNFAIRVALSQMLARRAGAQLRALFMDEGFGTQDDEGRQRLVEALTAIQDHFDLVLVITHVEELRDAFPVQIQVDKTPEGSRIRMR